MALIPGRTQYLIEVPHSPEECPAAQIRGQAYCGCGAGTHTTWVIAELAAEEEAWSLVPTLLRDTARVVAVDRCRPHAKGAAQCES